MLLNVKDTNSFLLIQQLSAAYDTFIIIIVHFIFFILKVKLT